MYKRAWGVLKMDASDEWLLDGYQIKGKRGTKDKTYVQVSLRSNTDRSDCRVMSRVIMNAPDGMEVDHINHDSTDNRRCNLRVCTRSQNRRNGRKQRTSKSRFKGVFYHPAKKYNPNSSEAKPWRAYTRVMGKRKWLGYFATEFEAAMAYNRFAAKEFGEFACFNRFDWCPVWPAKAESDGQAVISFA